MISIPPSVNSTHTHIPLSLIPAALQSLDLQPDDPDVLAVFQNAASGWEASRGSAGRSQDELRVSRKDWRAVCAALLDTSAGDDGDEGDRAEEREDEDIYEPGQFESGGSEDEYVGSAGEDPAASAVVGDDTLTVGVNPVAIGGAEVGV